jgi:hypothetical protein
VEFFLKPRAELGACRPGEGVLKSIVLRGLGGAGGASFLQLRVFLRLVPKAIKKPFIHAYLAALPLRQGKLYPDFSLGSFEP